MGISERKVRIHSPPAVESGELATSGHLLAYMDAAGIDIQVLSLTSPGAQALDAT